MKKIVLLTLLSILFFRFQGISQVSRHYTCYRTVGKIITDGILDEPDWALAAWSDDFVDITGDPKLKPSLQTRVKMLRSDEYLYIAAELSEPDLWASLTKRDEVIFQDNDFEIFLDPDGNGQNYYEIEVNALGTIWDLMLTTAYSKGGKPVNSWDLNGLRSGIHLNGSLNDPASADSSWIVEMALPIEELMSGKLTTSSPADGVQWRINFSRVEWKTKAENGSYHKMADPETRKNLPEQNWVWSPMGKIDMHIPERWGRLEFSDEYIRPKPAHFANAEQKMNFSIWLWMNGYPNWNTGQWDSLFRELKSKGVHGILTQADVPTLSRMLPLAQKQGIVVEKWFVALLNTDPGLLAAHPGWFAVNREGKSSATDPAYVGYYHFFCPSNPEAMKYLSERAEEYLALPGLEGIHLDYIRYPDVILPEALWQVYHITQDKEYPQYDYCYCTVCRDHFMAISGTDPLSMDHPEESEVWRKFRQERITEVVKNLAVACQKKGKKISAAVFPGPALARKIVRQSWDLWPLDEVMPMLYQNFYFGSLDWIRQETAEGVQAMKSATPLYSGLYVPGMNPRELQSAVRKSIEGGASGISLFNLESMTPLHWEALKQVLTR